MLFRTRLLLFTAVLAGALLLGVAVRTPSLAGASSASPADGASPARSSALLHADPELAAAVARGGAFGGAFSRIVAGDIFGSSAEAVRDVQQKTRIVEVAPRTWLIRMPIVNVALFETDAGLLLVDTGMPAAGPAVLQAIRSLSDKPLHTVIYTHGHVDHAYGAQALLDAGEQPEIIAHENLPRRFDRYLRLRGSLARYMGQPPESLPRERADMVWPTRTFKDRLELQIGGEMFVLQHHRGETDDQLYVWAPARRALASADFYQGFLPNAGNGKRVQRYPEEWAVALREMAQLGALHLLPAHGASISDDAGLIRRNFLLLSEALQSIVDQTLAGLNRGLRRDQIYRSVTLPEHLAREPTLREQYVSVQDISKMVIRRYTGWWDDIPSRWSPAPLEAQARELARLAGGAERLAARARMLITEDIRLASHLVDWAWYAEPDNPEVQAAVLLVYRARALRPDSNTMELVAYIKQMQRARERQLEAQRD